MTPGRTAFAGIDACLHALPAGMTRFAISAFAALALAGLPASASAQLLHEYFEYAAQDRGGSDGLPELPRPGAIDRSSGGEIEGAPVVFTPEGMLGESGPAGGRNGASRPDGPVSLDRNTDTEPRLEYAAVFTPSVAPFKRLGARDAVVDVGGAYELVVADATLRPAPSALPAGVDADTFIAALPVSTTAGTPVPLPSVAPDMAIVSITTRPNVGATAWVDGAGNFALVLDRDGEFDVEMVVRAPRSYFGGPLPPPRARPSARGGARLRADAAEVLRAAGADAARTDVELLEALLRWFRAFEARPFPEARRTNNAYLDIALGRIGVCRHRAQTFTMTAWAAGLNARYVFNDAHAFVEVELSDGWRRFDLGGASDGLDVLGASADQQHEPPEDPTLERAPIADGASSELGPENFPASRGDASGGPGSGDAGAPGSDGPLSDGGPRGAGSPPDPTEAGAPDARPTPTLRSIVEPIGANTPAQVGMQGGRQVVEFEPARPLSPDSSLTLEPIAERVFRGEPLRLRGRLVDADGRPLSGRTVDVHVGPRDAGQLDAPIEAVGALTTDGDGWFDGEVVLSPVMPLGEWGLYVSFAGDDDAGPAPPPR